MDNIEARIKRIYKENTLSSLINEYYAINDEEIKQQLYERIKALIIELYGI
jgi:hypothetical protein